MNHPSNHRRFSKKLALVPLVILFLSLFLSAPSAFAQWTGPDPYGKIYYNGGKVGIGTDDPQRALQVVGGMILGSEASGVNKNLTIESWNYAADGGILQLWGIATATENILRIGTNHSAFYSPTKLEFCTAENTTTMGGTRRMTINSAGNVGIAVSNPGEKLQVDGNVKLSGDLLSSDNEIQLRNTSTGAAVKLLANGDVCIGTGC